MDIRSLHKEGHSIKAIARMTGRSRNTIRRVLREAGNLRTTVLYLNPHSGFVKLVRLGAKSVLWRELPVQERRKLRDCCLRGLANRRGGCVSTSLRSGTRRHDPRCLPRKQPWLLHEVQEPAFADQAVEIAYRVSTELLVIKVHPIPDPSAALVHVERP